MGRPSTSSSDRVLRSRKDTVKVDEEIEKKMRTMQNEQFESFFVADHGLKENQKTEETENRVKEEEEKMMIDTAHQEMSIDVSSLLIPSLVSPSPSPNSSESSSQSLVVPPLRISLSKYLSKSARRGKKRTKRRSPVKAPTVSPLWTPLGDIYRARTYVHNDMFPIFRDCYHAAQHRDGEVIHEGDSITVADAEGESSVAKIVNIFVEPDTKDVMASILWYYRAEQCPEDLNMVARELLASRHIDTINLACVQERVFVLTFNEYCRFVAENKMDMLPRLLRPIEQEEVWSRGEDNYPRRQKMPMEDTPPELVYFCYRFYDFQKKKIVLKEKAKRKHGI